MPTSPSRGTALLRNQLGLARALWWVVRGRTAVDPGDVALPSLGPDRVMLWTITVLGLLETAVVHVLVALPWLRWSLLAVGIYGLVAIIAFDSTLRQHPHLLRTAELVLRFGHFRRVSVPLEHLLSVRRHVVNTHSKLVEVHGDRLALSYMGGTNVELRFAPQAEVDVNGRTVHLTSVSFHAHDERTAVALLRARVAVPER